MNVLNDSDANKDTHTQNKTKNKQRCSKQET